MKGNPNFITINLSVNYIINMIATKPNMYTIITTITISKIFTIIIVNYSYSYITTTPAASTTAAAAAAAADTTTVTPSSVAELVGALINVDAPGCGMFVIRDPNGTQVGTFSSWYSQLLVAFKSHHNRVLIKEAILL